MLADARGSPNSRLPTWHNASDGSNLFWFPFDFYAGMGAPTFGIYAVKWAEPTRAPPDWLRIKNGAHQPRIASHRLD
jgi:hypothetical protein